MKLLVSKVTDIGNITKAVRKSQQIRQDDLGSMAGCSHKFIVDVEKGKPTVQTELLLTLLTELGIDVYLDVPDSAVAKLKDYGLLYTTDPVRSHE